jgi:hypothetical protein
MHTPGPWTMTEQGSPSAYVEDSETSIGIESSDRRVAAVEGWDNALDNARLIAAAPDLLAALETMLRTPNDLALGPAIAQARAAIAKAKGTP